MITIEVDYWTYYAILHLAESRERRLEEIVHQAVDDALDLQAELDRVAIKELEDKICLNSSL